MRVPERGNREDLVGHLTGEPARSDRVDAHAAVGPVGAQVLGQVDRRGLRDRVPDGNVEVPAGTATDASMMIEPPPLASMCRAAPVAVTKVPVRLMSIDCAEQVGRHLLGHGGALGDRAGVGDGDVQSAEGLHRGRDRSRDLRLVGDVAGNRQRVAAGGR